MPHFKEWSLIAPEGYEIFGRTDYSNELSLSEKCIFIVHGYAGHMYEHLHVAAAQYFTAIGYDVVRFNLQSHARKLRSLTLKDHAYDLGCVLNEFADDYRQIFLVGHSFGGPAIMIEQPAEAAAICLWDPSFNLPALWSLMNPQKYQDFVTLNFGGNEVVAGYALMQEGRENYDTSHCLELSQKLNVPLKVINASAGEEFEVFRIDKKSWHSAGHQENCRVMIENSDHDFTQGESLRNLLEETALWFDKFSRK